MLVSLEVNSCPDLKERQGKREERGRGRNEEGRNKKGGREGREEERN